MKNHLSIMLCSCFMVFVMCHLAYADRVSLPKTGQTLCYDASGATIACSGTGQDGAVRKGIAWPLSRFTDNGDGTVKDNLTGLVWLKNANCSATLDGVVNSGTGLVWNSALTWSNALVSGMCGLTDGSEASQWRLPTVTELSSLVDLSQFAPTLPAGHPFITVQAGYYWSGSTSAGSADNVWNVSMNNGYVYYSNKGNSYYVWPVRSR